MKLKSNFIREESIESELSKCSEFFSKIGFKRSEHRNTMYSERFFIHNESRVLTDGTECFPAFFIDICRKIVRLCFIKKTNTKDLFDIYEFTHLSLYSIGQVVSELKLHFKI